MIDLSIIVPVYNVEKYIRSCIESIFMQSLDDANFEVIIVNDGSTDKTEKILRENCFNHITLQHNMGIGGAVQEGYKYCPHCAEKL